MAGEGAVRWMFERKGVITVATEGKTKEELELLAIELGAEDFSLVGETLDIYTKPEDLETVKKSLEEKQVKIESASLDFMAKEQIVISEKESSSELSQKSEPTMLFLISLIILLSLFRMSVPIKQHHFHHLAMAGL
jgi:transcriptional/translational regulatory protein YebC/TACO1